MKKISVLTSLYNCKHFLPYYYQGVLQMQNTEEIEILLLHNAPKEDELSFIKENLLPLDYVKHIVIPERETLYATWNRGIQIASGEYITIWNVDDYRFPDSLHIQSQVLDNSPNVTMVYGDVYISSIEGKYEKGKKTNEPSYSQKNRKEFLRSYHTTCFQMWRKSIHYSIGYYDEQFRCSGDFDFQIRVASKYTLKKTEQILGVYLADQPHKISNNGFQELENNIIYLRYGVYDKINYLSLYKATQLYKKKQYLFLKKWENHQETVLFSRFQQCVNFTIGFLKIPFFVLRSIYHKLKERIAE